MRRHRVPLRTPDEGKAEVGDSRASLDDQVDHQASHHGYENERAYPEESAVGLVGYRWAKACLSSGTDSGDSH